MTLPRPFTSLVLRLALVYLGLALFAALILRGAVLTGELSALDRELHAGWLGRATATEAAGVGAKLEAGVPLNAALDAALADLRSPRDPNGGPSDVLAEFPGSLSVALYGADGRLIGQRGAKGGWLRTLAPAQMKAWHDGRGWLTFAPANTGASGYLGVRLKVRPPGWRALLGDSFEAPALIIYALVFAFGSVLVLNLLVTRRLKRFELAAEAWGGGDFGPRTAEAGQDEIGRLGRRLDAMAADLKDLVALRARIASLSERERLAVELHDTVKQKAFALQLQLASLKPDPRLAAAVDECRRITAEIQSELAALIEPAVIGGPLEPSAKPFSVELEDRARTWARRGGFDLRARTEPADAIPADQRAILLRVLDEALANVMRHSGARTASVDVRRRGDRFELTVSDDGRGLEQAVDGLGLNAMRRRAAELPRGRLLLSDASPGARLSLKWSAHPEAVR